MRIMGERPLDTLATIIAKGAGNVDRVMPSADEVAARAIEASRERLQREEAMRRSTLYSV